MKFSPPIPRSACTARAVAAFAGLALAGLSLAGCSVVGGKHKVKDTPTVGERVPVLSHIESGAKVDAAIAGLAVVLPPPQVNADWPQPGGAPSKAVGNLALADGPQRLWSAQIAGSTQRQRLAAAPVVGGGQLFAFDTNGDVHAFSADTGHENWRASLRERAFNAAVFGGGASFDEGKLYVTTGLGEAAAFEAQSGKPLWKVKPAGPLRGSPTVAFGAVYVMTQDNQLVALNQEDGAQLWAVSGAAGQSGVFGVAAPAAGQGTVIAGYSTGELTAYRYENGRQLWSDALARTSIATSVSTLTDVDADPIIDDGRVYALGQGGRMAAYELVTGQRIWELSLSGISTPALAGDWIFVLTDDARLLCIAKASGKVRWITQLQHWGNARKKSDPVFWTGPVLANNKLWVASSKGELYAVASADGAATFYARIGKGVSLAPVVAKNTLYVLDDGGRISAFR